MDSITYRYRRLLPPSAGLYYVYAGSELLYIGATSNLQQRFTKKHHHQDLFYECGVTHIGYVLTPDYIALEPMEILRLKPRLNRYLSHWFRRYRPHSIFEGDYWKQLELAF